MASYTTKPKTGKWTIVAMSYVLDMARMNSQTVYEANNSINGFNSFDPGWLLVNSHVAPHMHNRIEQGLTMTLKSSMMKFMGKKEPESQPLPPNDNILRRCKICLDKTHGVGYKVTGGIPPPPRTPWQIGFSVAARFFLRLDRTWY